MNLDNWPAARVGTGNRSCRDRPALVASDALAAGVSIFELARIMGMSVRMIERHFGALLDGAGAGIASRLDALDAKRERAAEV